MPNGKPDGVAAIEALFGPLDPDFQNIRGQMNGYSQSTNKPTARNLKAFMRDLEGSLDYIKETEGADWDDVLEAIENGLIFWVHYHCGQKWKGQ